MPETPLRSTFLYKFYLYIVDTFHLIGYFCNQHLLFCTLNLTIIQGPAVYLNLKQSVAAVTRELCFKFSEAQVWQHYWSSSNNPNRSVKGAKWDVKHKIFTSGLLCCNNHFLILVYFVCVFFLWDGPVAHGKYFRSLQLQQLHCWHVTCFLSCVIHCCIGMFWHQYIVSNIFGEKVKRNALVLGDVSLWVQIFSTHLFDKRPFITFTHYDLHHTATLISLINQHSQKTDTNEQLANKVARSNVDLWLSLSSFPT